MSSLPLQYRGSAQVYLQGLEALEPSNGASEIPVTYYVGCPESNIFIRDYRLAPSLAARRALTDQDDGEFAEVFSQPASIEVRATDDLTEIELHDGGTDDEPLTLWLGVIDDGRMAVHEIEWETIKFIGETIFAFAALVY